MARLIDCPTCGKTLATRGGMRQHHTKVHTEPLPNRTCNDCHQRFYDSKAQRSYCDECNPNAGKNNGNWTDAREAATCELCRSEFSYYPSNKDGTYCSDCVASADGLLPRNPSRPIQRVAAECLYCKEELHVLQSRLDRRKRGVFCDQGCYGKWLSENVIGEAHHQWEGGPIEYGRKWWRVRRLALERDGYTCQHCGKTNRELGQQPDIHHLQRVRDFDNPQEAHTLENVTALCRSCHRRIEGEGTESPDEPTQE